MSRYHTKRFLVGSDVKDEDGLKNAPADRRLEVETVSNPAATDVTPKEIVENRETIIDIKGIESAEKLHRICQ